VNTLRRWVAILVEAAANATIKAFLLFAIIWLFFFPTTNASGVSDGKFLIIGSYLQDDNSKKLSGYDKVESVFSNGFEIEEGEGVDVCAQPGIQPGWMTGQIVPWTKLLSPRDGSPVPTYPNGVGFAVPIGADRGAWISGKFTAQPNQTVILYWELAQAKPNEGYGIARPALGMSIVVSPCVGDLRTPMFSATDLLAPGCRKYGYSNTLIWTTKRSESAYGYCALIPGREYYLTVSPVDIQDGLTPGEHTCTQAPSSQDGCDVQAKQSAD
jgi:hypothetical protein